MSRQVTRKGSGALNGQDGKKTGTRSISPGRARDVRFGKPAG